MKILIKVDHPQISLVLQNEEEEVRDQTDWEDQNNLSLKLLPAIDDLLKKNELVVQDLEKVKVEAQERSFTSTRIARVTAVAINKEILLEN